MGAVLRLYARLTRRGILLLILAVASYTLIDVVAYVQTYPDEASRLQLNAFGDQPAVRMLEGVPYALDTIGGFVVWRGGWFLEGIVGVWAILTVSRLLRGEEDTGRAELIGAGAVPARRMANAGLIVTLTGCLLVGLSAFAAVVIPGRDVLGAVLFGLGLAGFGAVMAAVTAVSSQLLDLRRHAAGLGAGVLAATFVVRMVANSTDSRLWLAWFTPWGWMDRLRAFGENNAEVLLLYVVVTMALVAAALVLRGRRDLGAAILVSHSQAHSRMRLLQSPVRFAWRLTWGVLLAWAVGVAFYSIIMGSLIKAMAQMLTTDPNYSTYLKVLGLTAGDVSGGMLAFMAVVVALVISLYAAWRVGAVRAEEDGERAEHLLTRPLTRTRWLGGHVVLATVSVAILVLVNATATWFGTVMTDGGVTYLACLEAAFNLLPVVLLFGGLAVAMFGLAPRLTVAVPVAAAVAAYVLSFVGPAIDLPGWITGLSPFYHVALVPVADYALTQGLVMLALALALSAVGWFALTRRDVIGA